MNSYNEYDVGNEDLLEATLAEVDLSRRLLRLGPSDLYETQVEKDGLDCATVDLLIKMARDGELSDVADVLAGVASASHADWAGEILRMVMQSGSSDRGGDPNYATAAALLTCLVDQSLEQAHQICPHLLVYQAHGPDCYDLAFTIGNMVLSRKAKQATKLLLAVYNDETPHGQSFRSLVPCLLGTMVDFSHADWASELVQQLCNRQGSELPDYSVAGWCLAQLVFFGRPDWAAAVCYELGRQQLAWYRQEGLLSSVETWGGEGYVKEIIDCLQAGR